MPTLNGQNPTDSNQVAVKTAIEITTDLTLQEMKDLQEELWFLAGNSEFLIKDLFLALKTYEAVLDRTDTGLRSSRDEIFYNAMIYEHVINLLLLLNKLLSKHGDVEIFGKLPEEED